MGSVTACLTFPSCLRAQAERLLTNHNHEAALKFLDRALEQDPDHVEALEAKALVALQQGDGDTGTALKRLWFSRPLGLRCIQRCPYV